VTTEGILKCMPERKSGESILPESNLVRKVELASSYQPTKIIVERKELENNHVADAEFSIHVL
jgi:hypothetical protein